jgi:MuDR family transposase
MFHLPQPQMNDGTILRLSATFQNIAVLKETFQQHCLENNCPYFVRSSDPTRFLARCESEKCIFRFTAYKHKDDLIHIRESQLDHSYFCKATKTAKAKWLLAQVKKYNYKTPKDMMNTLRKEYGIQSNYNTVWKALNQAKKDDLSNTTLLPDKPKKAGRPKKYTIQSKGEISGS